MRERKPILLFEQFGIPFPEAIDTYNLIGLQYSNEELSGEVALYDSVTKQFHIKGLALVENGYRFSFPNAYYISPNLGRLVYDIRESKLTKGGRCYYNFIRCIGTEEAKAKYLLDDGKTADMTYSDIMAEGFNIAVNTIFKCDMARLLDPKKPTIILVGCPSGTGWEKTKLAYAELLRSRLSLPDDITGQVYVAICKESYAAVAGELNLIETMKKIKRQDVIVLLNNDSNTFDIMVVGENGIPEDGEDSYQFGGDLIDESLLALMRNQLNVQYPDMRLHYAHGHKWGLRIAKEAYYRQDDGLRFPTIYRAALDGKMDAKGRPPILQFEINDDVMKDVLYRVPVSAHHITEITDGRDKKWKIDCESWMDGCRKIYQAFYDEMKKFFVIPGDAEHSFVPHRIIMRRAVSNIPEVKELAREVFGVESDFLHNPSYSVAEGLVFTLVFETRKAIFLRELLSELPSILPNMNTLKGAVIKTDVDEKWRAIKCSLKRWNDSSSSLLSIKDWSERFLVKEISYNLSSSIERGVKNWFDEERVGNIISEFVQKKFCDCFSEYENVSRPSFDVDFSALTEGTVGIPIDYAFFFGKLTSGEELNVILSEAGLDVKRNQAWRDKAYRNILQMEDKIRKGGSNKYSYRYMRNRIFLSPIEDTGNTTITYEGLEVILGKKITDSVVQGIFQKVLSLLEKPLKEYVESIPSPFNIGAW